MKYILNNIKCPNDNPCKYPEIIKSFIKRPRIFTDISSVIDYDEKEKSKIIKGLKNNEFSLVHQPKIDSRNNSLVGLEALIRWNHPEKGFLNPDKFLDYFYLYDIMPELDKFVIEQAKKDLNTLREYGYKQSISINAGIFGQNEQLDLGDLEIEILETEMVKNKKVLLKRLNGIKNKVLLDDFGTGYSSLLYLQDFRIDVMKLDRAFIKNIDKNTIVLETIIYLAKMLNMEIIAEGVETKEQLKWCQNHGVFIIQGFLSDKPESLGYIINKYF